MPRKYFSIVLALGILFLSVVPVWTQDTNGTALVEIGLEVGYDTYFREGHWFPVRIRVRNEGDPVIGKLVVRPETSGRVVSNAYSTPIDLPTGSDKATFLYLQARTFPPSFRVELLDTDNTQIAVREGFLNLVRPQDQLHVTVTGANGTSPTMSAVHTGEGVAFQAQWQVQNIPDAAEALRAITTLMLTDVDTTELSVTQVEAIEAYVMGGGHLIVTGGSNWRSTAEGITDLLPFVPTDSTTISDLTSLAQLANDYATELTEETIIATGDVQENAIVLSATEEYPLLMRHQIGSGIVDYLVADPNLEPLRSWQNLPDLWFQMMVTVPPKPSWLFGFQDFRLGGTALSVLPGVELLPPIQTLCLFIFVYIAVTGPLNYYLLGRIRRRGWAWFTIPLAILGFSVIAWSVGFNLRGNEVIISRLNIVEDWADTDEARLQQMIGVLSPRRDTFSLTPPQSQFIHVAPTIISQDINANEQSSAEINQSQTFVAQEFAVDGGIFANFATAGQIESPTIGGSVVLRHTENTMQSIQGVIRNDSDVTLYNPVILAQGIAYHLNQDLAPGDSLSIDEDEILIANENLPAAAAPVSYGYGGDLVSARSYYVNRSGRLQTVSGIMGEDYSIYRIFDTPSDNLDENNFRRQRFLESFILDQFATGGRGNQVYLVAWANEWDDTLALSNTNWSVTDTTLYIIALETEVEQVTDTITIPARQFTWVIAEYESELPISNRETNGELVLYSNDAVVLQFTPLAESRLTQIDELLLDFDRVSGSARYAPVEIWNWRDETWIGLGAATDTFRIRPEDGLNDVIGSMNSVRLRLSFEESAGSATIRQIRIEQEGTF